MPGTEWQRKILTWFGGGGGLDAGGVGEDGGGP